MATPQNLTLLKSLSALNAIWMSIVAGQALSLYLFSIPLIKEPQTFPNASLIMIRQFHLQIKFGITYIQTSTRIQGLLLAVQAYLFYAHGDEEISGRWRYAAWALVVGLQVAWYEAWFVFPTNERLVEMGGMLETGDRDQDRKVRGEVLRLLEKWRWRHIPRIVLPAVSAAILVGGIMF